ncbi:MAG: AMP-binding protein [Deltaproteobacteria bacterium]|nr:AMP-binding protein [Deltaproteobacteria bacterium]
MSLLRRVRARSAVTALLADGGVTLSWADLDDRSRAFAAHLRARGVRSADRVAVQAPNSVEVVVALLACHRLGAIYVPVNPGYQDQELAHIVSDSTPRLLLRAADLTVSRSSAAVANEGPVDAAQTALLIYTSGTTGKSKGCMLSFANVQAAVTALMGLWEISPADEIVHALPLFHVHGLCVALHGALLTGARTRLLPRFSPEHVVDAIRAGGTVFMGVPTMYRRLLDHLAARPGDGAVLAGARLFCCGSAPLPAADLEEFSARTGHRIIERYGMSETLITLSNPLTGTRKPGSVGQPIPGVRICVGSAEDSDELLVQGPGVMQGYWKNADATAKTFEHGWMKTGDLVRVDDDGYVTIVGRLSTDILKVGGYKISTREIEEALADFPGLLEVAVVGVPDREWGQRVVACIVGDLALRARPRDELLRALQAHVRLYDSKKPRGVLMLTALPRNAMGKVQKSLLARQAVAAQV